MAGGRPDRQRSKQTESGRARPITAVSHHVRVASHRHHDTDVLSKPQPPPAGIATAIAAPSSTQVLNRAILAELAIRQRQPEHQVVVVQAALAVQAVAAAKGAKARVREAVHHSPHP